MYSYREVDLQGITTGDARAGCFIKLELETCPK